MIYCLIPSSSEDIKRLKSFTVAIVTENRDVTSADDVLRYTDSL